MSFYLYPLAYFFLFCLRLLLFKYFRLLGYLRWRLFDLILICFWLLIVLNRLGNLFIWLLLLFLCKLYTSRYLFLLLLLFKLSLLLYLGFLFHSLKGLFLYFHFVSLLITIGLTNHFLLRTEHQQKIPHCIFSLAFLLEKVLNSFSEKII